HLPDAARLPRARTGHRRGAPRGGREARRRGRVRGRLTTGLLGGAFDPPHTGHLVLAREASARFGLDRLLVLVIACPGHKRVETPVEDRLAPRPPAPAPAR